MTVPVILDFVLNNIRRCDTYTDCDCNHCLSNAMHGQNINLPVCMCVCVCLCVRHTFCQLHYMSDPSTDFYN